MEIYIEGSTKKTITLHVNQNDTIENIKGLIQQEIGIAASKQTLTFNGKKLLNLTDTLSQYNIKPKSVINLTISISVYVIYNNAYCYIFVY